MQQIKTAVALFCTACICAELVGQLLGDIRGRQCIKAAAGLYILVAVFHAMPALHAQTASFALPQTEAASFGTAEDAILRQAGQELEAALEAQLTANTGQAIRLCIALERADSGVRAVQVQAELPAGCPAQARADALRLLCGELELAEDAVLFTEGGGGT